MKKQLAIGLALAAAGAPAALVFAGDETHEMDAPQLYTIHKEVVKLDLTMQYEDSVRRMISEFKAYHVDPEKIHWKAISSAEMGYVYVTPIENFAGLDSMHANWMEVLETIGEEKFEEILRPADEAVDHVEAFQVARLPELSYEPEEPRITKDEMQYIHYGFYYVVPGRHEEFEAIARDFVQLYKEKGIDSGWAVYRALTGTDLPVYVVAQGARNEADYYANRERLHEILGEEVERIGKRVYGAVRKMEQMGARIRPDLSFPPPEEMPHSSRESSGHEREHGHGH